MNNKNCSLDELETILNYRFKNLELLAQALTRQSAITEGIPGAGKKTYQRLEFLGDSLLHCVVSEFIFSVFPEKSECDMTNLRIFYEKNDFIGKIAKTISVGKFLKLGKGEEKQNMRENLKLLADVFEAIIGAVFVDSGDFNSVKTVVLNLYQRFFFEDKNMKENMNNMIIYYNNLNHNFNNFVNRNREITNENVQNNLVSNGPNLFLKGLNFTNNFGEELKNVLNIFEENECLFHFFVRKISKNLFIEFDLLHTFNGNLFSNISMQTLKTYIFILSNQTKEYFYNFDLKPHFICCKIFLYLITLYDTSDEFIYFSALSCLTHNGICEFYCKNFESAKEFFEKALFVLNEKQIVHAECQLLITFFLAQILPEDQKENILNALENDKTIKAVYEGNAESGKYSFVGKAMIKYLRNKNQISNLKKIEGKTQEINKLNEEILSYFKTVIQNSKFFAKLYFEVYFETLESRNRLNCYDFLEMKKLELEVKNKFGENSIFLENFYRFYLKFCPSNVINENHKYLVKVLLENYPISSKIVLSELQNISNLIIQIN